ncbi:decarboxylase [Candidatus Woesearchaeota archaeon]|nr:decarboxylase [Candidatus Woesearchaeota archaeon]|tara:strand:+ start:89 stop:1123 length:1035 start_codon:yes stop_codon:yes gene_type:complete
MQKAKFILSKKKTLDQYNKIKDIADNISYSLKTNPQLISILESETDTLFSLHMQNELHYVKDQSRIIFLAQAWTPNDIEHLLKKKITHFVVDNETDLNTIISFLKTTKHKIKLFLRMKLKENTLRTERYYVFGMPSETINKYIQQLANHPNIEELGIHFHRKTQNMSEWNYKYELQQLIEPETLTIITSVNIGGGLPSAYANTNMDVFTGIYQKIKELKEWLNKHNTKLIIEPGRFLAASPIKLKTTIIGIHENTIIVNASVYNTDMDALIVPVKLLIEGELPKQTGTPYIVKGLTPCSLDLFRYKVYLDNPNIGDTLTFLNAGAYNFTTDFCGLEKLETEVTE